MWFKFALNTIANDPFSDRGTPFWIDPSGQEYLVSQGWHDMFAMEILQSEDNLSDKEQMKIAQPGGPTEVLVSRGWIRKVDGPGPQLSYTVDSKKRLGKVEANVHNMMPRTPPYVYIFIDFNDTGESVQIDADDWYSSGDSLAKWVHLHG